jgi:DNA primase
VLLLPDGDDPDSFARKHSTDELKSYINEHQTDFIEFKTRLTLDHVSDPIERSKAITSIVRSIAYVRDPILRDTYITNFAQRCGLKESPLLQTMNKFIQKDIEDRKKERERMSSPQAQAEGTGNANETTAEIEVPADIAVSLPTPNTNVGETERRGMMPNATQDGIATLLMRELVRHGEEIIYNNVETEDGQHVDLSVAEYIAFDLAQDGIRFPDAMYNQMLDEAIAHIHDPGFEAMRFFTQHPDPRLSQAATDLAIDRHQLGGRFLREPREGELKTRVEHLVMDYRRHLMEQRLKSLQDRIKTCPPEDLQQLNDLILQFQETQQLRDMLAKQLGNDIIV